MIRLVLTNLLRWRREIVSEIRIESYAFMDIEETGLGCRLTSSPHNIQSILATNRPSIVNSNSVAMQTELN